MELLRRPRDLVRTGLLIIAVRLGLRIIPLPRLLRWLHPRTHGPSRYAANIEELAYYIDRWLDIFPYNVKGNCFPRALVLYRLARGHGIPVMFRCGVVKNRGGLEGHAWLTCVGEPFLERASQWKHFTVTFSFPPDSEG